MTLLHFRDAAGDDASGQANEGRGKLALVPHTDTPRSPHRSAALADNRLLFDHVVSYVHACQPRYSRAVIAQYLVALKRQRLVVLVDSDQRAAAMLMHLVAEAIVGAGSGQLVPIAGAAWHTATGQDGYFRSVHERFSALRLQEIAQAATDPANLGKAYFLCFEALTPGELALYNTPHGGLVALPEAVAATAIATPEQAPAFCAFQCLYVMGGGGAALRQRATALPPPAGMQRLWLRANARELAMLAPNRVALSAFPRRSVA